MKIKSPLSRSKTSRRRRVPSPKEHTTESFRLHYEDLHSARRFKLMHFMFLSVAFLVIAGAFSIAMIYKHGSEATAEITEQSEILR